MLLFSFKWCHQCLSKVQVRVKENNTRLRVGVHIFRFNIQQNLREKVHAWVVIVIIFKLSHN